MTYIMITPVMNESSLFDKTVQSIISQSELPALWAIIDGGSADGTWELINLYAKKYTWMLPLKQQIKDPFDTAHLNVSLAVKEAYEVTNSIFGDYDYIWTIDADQVLEPDVCAGVIASMDKTTGAASGQVYNPDGSKDTYPNGEISNKRVYRRDALESIGGFPITKYSYDTVILAKMRLNGWNVRQYSDYKIQNLREDMGIEHTTPWRSNVKWGKARWYLGYSPSLLVLGCGYTCMKGQIGKSVGTFYGYTTSFLNGDKKIQDDTIRNYFGKERIKEYLWKNNR